MSLNKNLLLLEPYGEPYNLLEKGLEKGPDAAQSQKRHHFNESSSTILGLSQLLEGVLNAEGKGMGTIDINHYPDDPMTDLLRSAGRFYATEPSKIIPVNGSDEGIDLIIRTLSNPSESILVLNPTFSMYEQFGKAHGLEINRFNLGKGDFHLNAAALIDEILRTQPSIVFIANPLAHIGGLISQGEIRAITEAAKGLKNDCFVVIDEAYIEFTNAPSSLQILNDFENLIILRTLSKFFGLAGLRLGFVFTHKVNEFLKIKAPYNIGSITCKIGSNLFNKITLDAIETRRAQNQQSVIGLAAWLESNFGPKIARLYPTQTNFILVELNCSGEDFATELARDHNMRIKTFGGPMQNFCRISV